ncbi:unnamed protein product, partial [Rotaria socialis]
MRITSVFEILNREFNQYSENLDLTGSLIYASNSLAAS